MQPDAFLDLHEQLVDDASLEEGLLGLAFPPSFPENAHVYVTYVNRQGKLILSRFQVTDDGSKAIAPSEEILIAEARFAPIHRCGHITFGPMDGFLYMCIGDTNSNERFDELKREDDQARRLLPQRPDTLKGKIIRIDVEHAARGYTVPSDNPFADREDARPEIWLYGLRNPWRFSFDSKTGDMYIPDVGNRHWEELNHLPVASSGGSDFGWPAAEANECLMPRRCEERDPVWPIHEYPQPEGRCGIIGGNVYHGKSYPAWDGVYVFGDLCSGELWGLRRVDGRWQITQLAESVLAMTAIGDSPDHEVILADQASGRILQLEFPPNDPTQWRDLKDASLDMLIATKRRGYSRARTRLEAMEERVVAIYNSTRWRITEPLAELYQLIRRPFRAN